MLLNRILEAETVQSHSEASEYDAMDHSGVNAQFVKDLIASGPLGQDCLDIGTGTALIPIELCRNDPVVRVMAMDASREMLELARYRLEVKTGSGRCQKIDFSKRLLRYHLQQFSRSSLADPRDLFSRSSASAANGRTLVCTRSSSTSRSRNIGCFGRTVC